MRDEPVTSLLRQRVDLEDFDFALDHGHVVGEPMLGVATTLSAGAGVGTRRS
ncbi:hypothetical protein ACVGVM_02025 [Pseudonocardia bannensis]|uniref:hypothetical protein n=1 Tax=Pseudonocardia bannensis TaxID=630973 RepID=UPI001B7CEE2B|nr:hypothetical protein [Pseudonocardia bannensis]